MELRYPNLVSSKILVVDIETYDPDLTTLGPAIHRGGYITGVGIADDSGFSEYYDLNHPDTTDERSQKNRKYLTEVLALPVPKLGHNLLYDLDWLINGEGFEVGGLYYDTMVAEALINELQGNYKLDFLGEKYLGEHKRKSKLIEICARNGWTKDPRSHIWKMDYDDVRDYVLGDIELPRDIFKMQWSIMREENTLDLFLNVEMALFPLLIQMRSNGVRVDKKLMNETINFFADSLFEMEDELNEIAGFDVRINNQGDLGKVLDKFGIPYPLTAKTKRPSVTKDYINTHKDKYPLLTKIFDIRKFDKLLNTFLESQVRGNLSGPNKDRIYTSFHPTKTDDNGTVSGRLSASHPNLQFIPSQGKHDTGKYIRRLFLPEEGHVWGKVDYSQMEIVVLLHYASGEGAEDARQHYINSVKSGEKYDYHAWCAELVGMERKPAKVLNFGMMYGK